MKQNSKKKVLVTVQIDTDVKKRLAKFSESSGLSQAEATRIALQEYIDRHRDDYSDMKKRMAVLLAKEKKYDE